MLKFWISAITAAGGLAVLAIGSFLYWQAFRLERAASIRPGVFTAYRRVEREDAAIHLPVFRFETSDGTSEEVEGDFPHLTAFFAPGDAIEVLVPEDGERSPRIRSFGPLYGLPAAMVVAGSLLVFFPFVLGGFRRVPVRADYGTTRKEDAPRTAWLGRGLLLGALALLGYVWTQTRGLLDGEAIDTERDGEAPPPAAAKEREAARPTPEHPSAAHAARAGDHEALLAYVARGVDLNEINPANLVAPISNGHVQTLRVLFENGYEQHRYAGSTIGDLGIKYNRPEVVRLVQEFGGPFGAPPEYVALVLGDGAALKTALADREEPRNFMHRDLDWWAAELGQESVLEQARLR